MFFQAPLSGSRRPHISTVFLALELLVCLTHGKQKKIPACGELWKKPAESADHDIISDFNFLLIGNAANRGIEPSGSSDARPKTGPGQEV
ncbi:MULTISPECIES: hypothetical protein [unclassified Mesorhizobium]|uniref:hypothetical protein n=1 Tax=unclassified Mesorhizobium TaxID=325217 RepID=UPI00333900E3